VVAAPRAALCDQSCHQLFAACEQQAELILDPVQLIWCFHKDPSTYADQEPPGFPARCRVALLAGIWVVDPHPEDESPQAKACC